MATEAQIIANRTFKPNLVKIREICGYFFYKTNPICQKSQMDLTSFNTGKYAKLDTWSDGKNKPKQTQFKPNSQNEKMLVAKVLTRNYENARLHSRPKTNPIKPNSNRSRAQVPAGKLPAIFEPGTQKSTKNAPNRPLIQSRNHLIGALFVEIIPMYRLNPSTTIFSVNCAKFNRSSDIFIALLDTGKESSKC